jgi:hypothetical protein
VCDSGTNDKIVNAYVVTRPEYGRGTSCTYRDGATLIDAELSDAEEGDSIVVTLRRMTEEQLDNLPEFEGW